MPDFNEAKQMVVRVDLTGDTSQLDVAEALHDLADDVYNGFRVEPEYGLDDTNPIIRTLILTEEATEEDLELGAAGQFIYRLWTMPHTGFVQERLGCIAHDMYGCDMEDATREQREHVWAQFVAEELGVDPDEIIEDVRRAMDMVEQELEGVVV